MQTDVHLYCCQLLQISGLLLRKPMTAGCHHKQIRSPPSFITANSLQNKLLGGFTGYSRTSNLMIVLPIFQTAGAFLNKRYNVRYKGSHSSEFRKLPIETMEYSVRMIVFHKFAFIFRQFCFEYYSKHLSGGQSNTI